MSERSELLWNRSSEWSSSFRKECEIPMSSQHLNRANQRTRSFGNDCVLSDVTFMLDILLLYVLQSSCNGFNNDVVSYDFRYKMSCYTNG